MSLKSASQSAAADCACASVVKTCSLKNSSRARALKLSILPFCIGLPGSIKCSSMCHRLQQMQLRMTFGRGAIGADEWIFQTVDGGPVDPRAFSKRFARLVEKTGLGVRLHDLRHSYRTLALAVGVPLQTVSRSLGHSGVGITDKIYVHRVEQLERDAADRIDAVLGSAVRDALQPAVGDNLKASVPQRCHAQKSTPKKARGHGLFNGCGARI